VAFGAEVQYADFDTVVQNAKLLVVLDGVGDPHNLGAIVRTANAAGADAVLIPEPLHQNLPVIGRGSATWNVVLKRPGPPVHEVMRPLDEPSVLAAGAELVARLGRLGERLSAQPDPQIGSASVFVGQIHSGEIFNQYPQECWLEGTRRWLPGTSPAEVERDFRTLLADMARDTRTTVDLAYTFIRDAFRLEPGGEERKATGSFYTPRSLARWVTQAAIEPLLGSHTLPRVLDPAMGAGVFLIEAAHFLAARLGLLPP